ncbi:MAG: hypothetical protein VKK59_06310 [Vampirovibrionales bacterium]|nr:hypothetical protein [Vampirovibrionales bacterium]
MSTKKMIWPHQYLDDSFCKANWQVTAYVKLVSRLPKSRSRRIVDYLLIDEPESIAGLSLDGN